MVRVKRGYVARNRRKKILKFAKGFTGAHSRLFRTSNQQVMKSLTYSFVGRKRRKRDFRSLWICRINALSREYGLTYSQFKNLLKRSSIELNLKVLSQLALLDKGTFFYILETLTKE
jgi:large subunit ribosomal protein L20|tara:strand:- start:315 stop:665 length:351 start_codon:yes stop_codon:yes gene_type:complete